VLRAALVGCGRIARDQHLPALRGAAAEGLAELVGVCDVARDRASGHGVPAFGDVGEMLAALRPDVVHVTTLPSSHRDLVLAALEAGCHVLCEKPIAMNAADAAEMVAAAERARRLLSICFEYRYWDEAVYLRERIARGDLGRVHHVRTWGGAAHAFPASPAYRDASVAGGGVLAHWTIHNLDLALWLLGSPEPITASAVGHLHAAPGVEALGVGLIRLSDGASLSVEASFVQPPSSRPEGWELLGERGAAWISPLRVWLERDGAWVDDTPPAGTLAPCDYDMTRLIHDFLRRASDGGPAPVAADEIVRVQRLMDALYASAREGREVAVNPRV
jgi:predicted dehydrogenase